MRVILLTPALRGQHKAAPGQPIELEDDVARRYIDQSIARAADTEVEEETAEREPKENAAKRTGRGKRGTKS